MPEGELLRTETFGNQTFEFRRGCRVYPIVVWRDGSEYARFNRVELGWSFDPPLMHVVHVSDLVWRADKPVGTHVDLSRIGGEIWRQETNR